MILGGSGDGQVRPVMSDDPHLPPDRLVLMELEGGANPAPDGTRPGLIATEVTYVRIPRRVADDGPRWYYVRRKPQR
jgi:hypothetical protein